MLLKRQREVKEVLKHEAVKKRMKIEENQRDSFRQHMSGKFAERQTASDLYKSQKACEQLDRSKVKRSSLTKVALQLFKELKENNFFHLEPLCKCHRSLTAKPCKSSFFIDYSWKSSIVDTNNAYCQATN